MNSKVNMSQLVNDTLAKSQNNVKTWVNEYNQLLDTLNTIKGAHVKQINGKKTEKDFCPYISFVTIDALESKDYPNNIAANSIYVCFEIYHTEKKVEIHSCGHIYISEEDKNNHSQYKYLAMHSMLHLAKVRNVKGLRKSKYKDIADLAQKINSTFENIMAEVEDYTGGYPYKQGIKPIEKGL